MLFINLKMGNLQFSWQYKPHDTKDKNNIKEKPFYIVDTYGELNLFFKLSHAAIVGGSIDHVTRNMTAMIALETAKGNILIGVTLGAILISISLIISFGINFFKNDD